MPAPKRQRVKITLQQPESKAFTSQGPALNGSVLNLPEPEALRMVELGVAVPALEGEKLNLIEPGCNVESAATNTNPRGSFKVNHQRKLADTSNAEVRA